MNLSISLSPELESRLKERAAAQGEQFEAYAVRLLAEAIAAPEHTISSELDDATIDAINHAEDEADRGETVDLDTFREQFSKRITGI